MVDSNNSRQSTNEVVAEQLTMPGLPFTPREVQAAHDDVLEIVLETEWQALGLHPTGDFPNAWCSATSYSIGRLLLHRQLGEWRIAATSNHDWLEYVDSGDVIFSVDATQHQFPEYKTAWIGMGPPPRAELHPAKQWAVCGREPQWWPKKAELVVSAEVMRRLAA